MFKLALTTYKFKIPLLAMYLTLILVLVYPNFLNAKPFIATDVAVGSYNSCAKSSDGHLKCWGLNNQGKLGIGTTTHHGLYQNSMGRFLPELNLGSDFHLKNMTIGSDHICALSIQGQVKCWGNAIGLGHENNTNWGEAPAQMGDALPVTNLGRNFKAVGVEAGIEVTCAWSEDGRAKCWGSGLYAKIGLPQDSSVGVALGSMGDNLPALPLPRPVTTMSTGHAFTCAVAAGKVYCWGLDTNGNLGLESTGYILSLDRDLKINQARYVKLEEPGQAIEVMQLASSVARSCALYRVVLGDSRFSPQKIKCWGWNLNGALGVGRVDNSIGSKKGEMGSALPEVQLGMTDIEEISLGFNFGCARDKIGRVKCWGGNNDGTLGLGDTKDRGLDMNDLGKNLPYVDLGLPVLHLAHGANSNDHMCAVLMNHGVRCWGANRSYGGLGLELNVEAVGGEKYEMGDNLPFVKL